MEDVADEDLNCITQKVKLIITERDRVWKLQVATVSGTVVKIYLATYNLEDSFTNEHGTVTNRSLYYKNTLSKSLLISLVYYL